MIDLSKAPQQRPETYRPPSVSSDPVEAFGRAMVDYGLSPGEIEASEKLVRFDVDKRGDKAGWYVFYPGEVCAGAFGNWKTGLKENWCSVERSTMTDDESARYREAVEAARKQRETEETLLHEQARERAREIWEQAEPIHSHPYLEGKKVKNHGLRQSRGDLVVPVMDPDGTIHSLQFIKPDGRKKFLFGGLVEGCSFTIAGNESLYICEGFATAASIHEATGGTVICAFNAGNLAAVARTVREHCPNDQITVCADNDRFTSGNPGLKYATEAAKVISAKLVYPVFGEVPAGDDPELKYTDFNDLANVAGVDAVGKQVGEPGRRGRLPPLTALGTNVGERIRERPRPLDFIFRFNEQGLIPKGVVGVLTATGGTGKTFFLLSLAMAGAAGGNFGPINAQKPLNTLVLLGEDTQDELDRRLWDIGRGHFPPLLHAASVYGEMGPLMRLEGSSPVLADAYYWLEETITGHPGLELLILDPKSRFYGLDENNSEHATQWIQALEGLSKRHDLTIIFSHHTSKDQSGRISQNMSRGSSAIVDGCRWQGGLARMDRDRAQELGIENPRLYVLFDAPKSNYGADLPGTIIFKRNENGVLEYDEPGKSLLINMSVTLLEKIKNDPQKYTKRELVSRKDGAEIAREMKDEYPGFKRSRDMEKTVDYLLKTEQLFEEPFSGKRMVLIPTVPF